MCFPDFGRMEEVSNIAKTISTPDSPVLLEKEMTGVWVLSVPVNGINMSKTVIAFVVYTTANTEVLK